MIHLCEILFIILGINYIAKMIFSYIMLRKETMRELREQDDKRKYLMIIPVYKEQVKMESCLESIEKLEWLRDKLCVCICTTEKEPIDGADTHTLCQRILSTKELKYNYKLLRYDKTDGSMAEQVNYAYQQLREGFDIVCVYNADSILLPNVIKEVNCKFNNSQINCVQQRTIYNNYSGHNLFSIGYCLYQSRFEITNNLWRDLQNKGENVMGRGLFLRISAISDYIYPTEFFCEDMALSFELVGRNEKISSISSFEINEPPIRLNDIINQQYVWFHTAVKIHDIVQYAQKANNEKKINGRILKKILTRIWNNLIWFFTSAITFFVIVADPVGAILVYAYAMLIVIIENFFYGIRNKKTIMIDALCYILYLLVVSWGPYKYVLKRLAILLHFNLRDIKYKTPRTLEGRAKDENWNNWKHRN